MSTPKTVPAVNRAETPRHGTEHPQCPGCANVLSRTALVDLAYVFTSCDCDRMDYSHLYEQMWHLRCLRGSEAPDV